MSRLMRHAGTQVPSNVSMWFTEACEALEDYQMIVEDAIGNINDITEAFERGTARWSDEEIDQELEYIHSILTDRINEAAAIAVDHLIDEVMVNAEEAARKWKNLREEREIHEEDEL